MDLPDLLAVRIRKQIIHIPASLFVLKGCLIGLPASEGKYVTHLLLSEFFRFTFPLNANSRTHKNFKFFVCFLKFHSNCVSVCG